MRQLSFKLNKSKMVKRTISFVLFAIYTLASIPSLSAIPRINAFETYQVIQNETKELNLSLLANVELMIEQHQVRLENYIPLHQLPAYDSGEVISRRILKQTLKYWSDSKNIHSKIRQTAETIESAVSTDIVSDEGHKLSLKFRPLETQAVINYEGSVDASLAYDIADQQVAFVVSWNF